MRAFIGFVERHFVSLTLVGLALGLWFREPLSAYKFLLTPAIILSLFATTLKIDLASLFVHLRQARRIALLVFVLLLVVPFLLYWAARPLGEDFATAAALMMALPAGMTIAPRADILGGNSALALLFTALTHLLLPFTLALLFLATGIRAQVSVPDLFLSVAGIVLLPFAAAQLVRRFFPAPLGRLQPGLTAFNVLVISFLLVPLAASGVPEEVLADPGRLLFALVFWAALAFVLMLVGLHVPGYRDKAERVTLGLAFYHRNTALGIVIASLYLSPAVFLLCMGFQLILNALMLPFTWLVDRL